MYEYHYREWMSIYRDTSTCQDACYDIVGRTSDRSRPGVKKTNRPMKFHRKADDTRIRAVAAEASRILLKTLLLVINYDFKQYLKVKLLNIFIVSHGGRTIHA